MMPTSTADVRPNQASQELFFEFLQASRLLRQVRCQDDRGSYPRPVPKRYRLAQTFPAATYNLLLCWRSPPPPLCQSTPRATPGRGREIPANVLHGLWLQERIQAATKVERSVSGGPKTKQK